MKGKSNRDISKSAVMICLCQTKYDSYTTKLLTEEISLVEEGAFYRRREYIGFEPFRR